LGVKDSPILTPTTSQGNSLYNIVPDIISRLSGSDSNLNDDNYRDIMTFIFSFISKDKQVESLLEKICYRFKATRDEDQLRNLAFCLTLLPYSEKCFKKLVDCCSFYIDSLGDEDIFDSFQIIISKIKKNLKQDEKVDEFEEKLNENHLHLSAEKKSVAKAAAAIAECSNNDTSSKNKIGSKTEEEKQKMKKHRIDFSSSEESNEDEVSGDEMKENEVSEENETDKNIPDQNHTPIRRRRSLRNKSLLRA